MNIVFLSLCSYNSINERDIYTDLLREFIKQGHCVWIVSPTERKEGLCTGLIKEENATILRVKTGNIQKTNIVEKGISTVLLEKQFIVAIKKYLSNVKFDYILYATPPITLAKAVQYLKRRDGAKTYLMLKDIFPQNSLDLGMLSKRGFKAPIYWYFRGKEKALYEISDMIGCMSEANKNYILQHNPEISTEKVEICPNSIEVIDVSIEPDKRSEIRKKYNIPQESTVFLYGGNLGKPQGIDFLIACLREEKNNEKIHFLIIGDGTEYEKLNKAIIQEDLKNVTLLKKLPKTDYEFMIASCDVGLLFLDYRFTIPNFPSRLLSYMQARIPVLAVTDVCTDVGKVIENEQFGWWCPSNDVVGFCERINTICEMAPADRMKLGKRAWTVLNEQYNVKVVCQKLLAEWEKDV